MAKPKRRKLWLLAIVVVLIAGLAGLTVFQFRSGVRITVQNAGTTPLKGVVLHVTGALYALGDIALGKSATMRVKPTGESHLEIEFTDSDGETQRSSCPTRDTRKGFTNSGLRHQLLNCTASIAFEQQASRTRA